MTHVQQKRAVDSKPVGLNSLDPISVAVMDSQGKVSMESILVGPIRSALAVALSISEERAFLFCGLLRWWAAGFCRCSVRG